MVCLLAAATCVLMMVFPEVTVSASRKAIGIWMNAVVPSLLPFMIIAGYIKIAAIKDITQGNFYPIMMAFLSGYPMGAKLAGDQYKAGFLDEKGLIRLLCFAMITGPAFLIGGVGVSFYQSKFAGYILAFSHYAAAVTGGIFMGQAIGPKQKCASRHRTSSAGMSNTPFTDCILDSFRTLGIVLAYLILFMIAADFIQKAGFLDSMPEAAGAFCKGLLEMTVGCSEIAACRCSLTTKLTLSSFIISFGGLSVMGQTLSMLSDCPVTLVQIMRIKVLHGCFSAIWTFMICSFVV